MKFSSMDFLFLSRTSAGLRVLLSIDSIFFTQFKRKDIINANPVMLDVYIMHWVAVYLDKVGIVKRLLLNLLKELIYKFTRCFYLQVIIL